MPPSKATHSTGIARVLSKLGYCSRSQARALVATGRVRLNDREVSDPETPVAPGRDVLRVDGKRIGGAEKIYLMLNKPRGLVTTARDEKGRATVYSLLPPDQKWLAPVGRLDKASEGLLLLTNDTDWSARIASPETHLDKTYHVQVATLAGQELLGRLRAGIRVEGDLLRVKHAAILRSGEKNSWLELVLDEGKNRQIRRLLSAFGIEVLRLVRVAIGPLRLGDLPKGKVRELSEKEWRDVAGPSLSEHHPLRRPRALRFTKDR